MNQSFNPVFAFKNLFEEEDAKRVSSDLMYFPLLWKLISDKGFFLYVKKIFGKEPKNWTPKNIITKFGEMQKGETPPTIFSQEKDFENVFEEFAQISNSIQEIIENRKNDIPWEEIFSQLQINEINENFNKWEIVFSIVLDQQDTCNQLVDFLIKSNDSGNKLLASLINIHPGRPYFLDFVDRNIEYFIFNPTALKNLVINLEAFGRKIFAEKFIEEFLNHPMVTQVIIDFKKFYFNGENTFRILEKLNELHFLSRSINDTEKNKLFESLSKNIFENSILKESTKHYGQNEENSFDNLISLNKYLSITDHDPFHGNKNNSTAINELFLAFETVQSNSELVKEICKKYLIEFDIEGINNILFSPQEGYIIDPIDIAKLLINSGLELEAIRFLEKINSDRPNNFLIVRFLAFYSNLFGDHHRAVTYYSTLTIFQHITREEKIIYCNSLKYLGLWQEVLSIQKTINPLDFYDGLELVFSAYRCGNEYELKKNLEQLLTTFPNNKTVKAIEFLFQFDYQDEQSFNININVFTHNNKREIELIRFISEYLMEKEQIKYLQVFLDHLPNNYQRHPEIQLIRYKVHLKLGEQNIYQFILNELSKTLNLNNQNVLEEIIRELLNKNMMGEIKKHLDNYQGKWILSPTLLHAKAVILLEDQEYKRCEELVDKLMDDHQINEDIVTLYGCCLLETSISNFPFQKIKKEIPNEKKRKFELVLDHIQEKNKNLYTKLLCIEILGNEKENGYIDLIKNNTFLETNEYWRIPFGLGCLFFNKKKFDQAIIFFKEALKIKLNHKLILDLLIQAYCQLKLPDEAVKNIELQFSKSNLSLNELIRYSDLLYPHLQYKKYLENKKIEVDANPIFTIALARVHINNKEYTNAQSQLSGVEKLSDDYLLALSQLFIDCGDTFSAGRILDKYLSLNHSIDKNSIVESAAIFFQLNEFQKALNLLRTIKEHSNKFSLIEADILIKINEIERASKIIEEFILTNENRNQSNRWGQDSLVKHPNNWTLDLPEAYLLLIDLQLRIKNYDKAIELAKIGMKKFPGREKFRVLHVIISFLTGDIKQNKTLINQCYEDNYGMKIGMEAILADIALSNDQEIIAAKIISESQLNDHNIKLEVVRTRLLIKNGQDEEAKFIYQNNLEKISSVNLPVELISIEDIINLINLMMVCETAIEIGDLSTALQISRRVHNNLGLIPRNVHLYLIILTLMLERNRILEKLDVKNHLNRVTEEDLKILDLILEDGILEEYQCHQCDEWKIRARAVVQKDLNLNHEISSLNPTDKNISAIVYSLFTLGKKSEIEKVLSQVEKNKDGLYTYAVLEIGENPKHAISIFQNILQTENLRAEYYAALSEAYLKTENNSDAYSAIALALSMWPDEYEWERKAGQLCKILGNNFAAVSHYRKAKEYDDNDINPIENHENLESIGNKNKKILDGIEKNLSNTVKDIPIILEVANSLLDDDELDEIEPFLEKIKKYNLDHNEARIIEAAVEFNNKRYDESMKIIDSVLNKDATELRALKLKAKIINERDGIKNALVFLDSINYEKIENPTDLIIQKSKYIEQISGVESAIDYLKSEIKIFKDNIEINIFTANLIFLNGNPAEAQKIAEVALESSSDNAELLKLLSNISNGLGDLDKAIDYMVKSISIDPFESEKYILLSKMFEARRNYRRASDILIEGLDIIPNDFSLLKYLGLLLYKQGNFKEAYRYLNKAIEINSLDSDLKQIISIMENSMAIELNQQNQN